MWRCPTLNVEVSTLNVEVSTSSVEGSSLDVEGAIVEGAILLCPLLHSTCFFASIPCTTVPRYTCVPYRLDMVMLKTLPGIYRNGQIELLEIPSDMDDNTRVLITFLAPQPALATLAERHIDPGQAADLRARLATFTEDWERPEMDAYDDYDNARATL
jgi:hypothetical protein